MDGATLPFTIHVRPGSLEIMISVKNWELTGFQMDISRFFPDFESQILM